ncbi:MAG: PAS domain S-box protein, partial [Proteobacteria bacterium]|nr:PAS domain S-box protein [Pseudomonadota bacterium]
MLSEIFLTGETRDWVIQTCLAYSYDTWLVLLSCLVAMFASYTAFHLVTRVSAAPTRPAKAAWLVTGAVTMGGSIWSMHFIAMLAVWLPAPVRYDVMLTGLSVVFAIAASGFAFYIVTTGARTRPRLFGGGVVLGAGIGAMHYTGMAAIQMDATILYDPFLFAASVLVAVSLSTLALRLLYHSVESSRLPRHLLKAASGCVMGLSIAAMHYTAMAATYFLPTGPRPVTGLELDASLMAGIIGAAAFVIAGLALIASIVDRFMEIKNREARHSESFLAAVVNNTANGIIAIDEKGAIRLFNPAAERMFGYARSEVVGENVSILLPLEEREAHEGYVRNSKLYESRILGVRRPLLGRCKDGTSIDLAISVSDMQGDEGRTFIGVCHDITERKQAEEALLASEQALQERVVELELAQRRLERQGEDLVRLADDLLIARDEARAADRAKSEFLAAMSHELRTPLNAVIGFSEIIKDETFGPIGSVRYRDYASDIHESGQHLLALINDILDLSKVESGVDELHEENIEVPEILESVLRLV